MWLGRATTLETPLSRITAHLAVSHADDHFAGRNSPDFCARLASADRIGIDTEFVSEDTFRPELCLIQVATEDELAVIDPYRAGDLGEFWQTLADGQHTTIVHAAREEVNFALTACDRPPANLFDTQLAAGFCSTEYPSSYGSVVTKFLESHSRPRASSGPIGAAGR